MLPLTSYQIIPPGKSTQQTQYIESMLFYRFTDVKPTLIQRLVSAGMLAIPSSQLMAQF